MAKKKDDKPKEEIGVNEASSKQVEEQILSLQSSTRPVEVPQTEIKVEDGQEGKEEETKEEKGKPEEIKKEEMILGKFKSQDDLQKAYQEAEKKISQQGEESSQAKKQADLYRQHLSQLYEFDEEGNIAGYKQTAQQSPPPQQQDPLAGIRPYFPDHTDEQLQAYIGLNALMINAAQKQLEEKMDKKLKPYEMDRFERAVEVQRKKTREKYKEKIPNYEEYEKIADEKLAKLPPELRAKDGGVEMMLLSTVGEHTPDLLKSTKEATQKEIREIEEKKEETFVEGGGKSSVPTPPLDLETMTSEQLLEHYKKRGGKITQ